MYHKTSRNGKEGEAGAAVLNVALGDLMYGGEFAMLDI